LGQFFQKNKGFPILAYPNFKNKFPYISIIDEASNFKFGTQLEFSKAHHIIISRIKSGRGRGLEELPSIWGFHSIFTQWLKLTTSNSDENWAWPWDREAPKI